MNVGIRNVSYFNGLYDNKSEEIILPTNLSTKLDLSAVKIIRMMGCVYMIPTKEGYSVRNHKISMPRQIFKLYFGTTKKTKLKLIFKKNKIQITCQN